MTGIPAIQDAIRRLTTEELAEFRRWFVEFDAATWDAQFENDARSGRLDRLADEAADDFRQGRCS
jgi:hypothetical protein